MISRRGGTLSRVLRSPAFGGTSPLDALDLQHHGTAPRGFCNVRVYPFACGFVGQDEAVFLGERITVKQ